MKAKKLIEVALPIKEISAESVRDKSIRHGHISTLHLWWARRPLPVCRAIVFASLVPDPLDDNCPEAFNYAVEMLLNTGLGKLHYKPYKDIPYTSIVDEMEDNRRNRLMMFIGKFSETCQTNMKAGKSTSPKEQLDDWCLIKWENKNNPQILRIARELIFVAYQSDKRPDATWEQLHGEFNRLYDAIPKAEEQLYSIPNRHIETEQVKQAEASLQSAIEAFQNEMPSVFDPFAGGGAIPLEAARLGCRSYGNDINPVAHIIERGSAEFPQKYGKPIIYSDVEFISRYGDKGIEMVQETDRNIIHDNEGYHIPNRLAFDVEFYAKKILAETEKEVGFLYPADKNGNKPIAYYWARTAKCSNPSCGAEVPLLRDFTICNTTKKHYYLEPHINSKSITFEVKKGKSSISGWNLRGNLICPCCGSVTDVNNIRNQFVRKETGEQILAVIGESENGKTYNTPTIEQIELTKQPSDSIEIPQEKMAPHTSGGDIGVWGFTRWGDLFSKRQLRMLYTIVSEYKKVTNELLSDDYNNAIRSYLALWIDRIALVNTSMSRWGLSRETIEHMYNRQAISMKSDYPESNPFCTSSGSASNMLDWVLRYIETESSSSFICTFSNASSGDKLQFSDKELIQVSQVPNLPVLTDKV